MADIFYILDRKSLVDNNGGVTMLESISSADPYFYCVCLCLLSTEAIPTWSLLTQNSYASAVSVGLMQLYVCYTYSTCNVGVK